MKKAYYILLVGVLILAGLIFVGLNKDRSPVSIGLIAGQSGQYAFIGENYAKGAQLAVDEYNLMGQKPKVTLFTEDDKFDAKTGLSAYVKLRDINHIEALVNMTSPTINTIYSRVVADGIPVIQGGEQGSDPTDDNVFQIMPGNIESEFALGEYVKNLKVTKIVLVYTSDATFVRFADAFKNGYGNKIDEIVIKPDETDFRSYAIKLKEQSPDTVVFITVPLQGARLISEMNKIIVKIPRLIFDGSYQTGLSEYKQVLGDSKILDGSIVMMTKQTTNDEFVKAYKEKYNEEPGIGADLAYDAVNLLLDARATSQKTWVGNIKKFSGAGASGEIKFDQNGVRTPQFEMKTIKGGVIN